METCVQVKHLCAQQEATEGPRHEEVNQKQSCLLTARVQAEIRAMRPPHHGLWVQGPSLM